MKTYIKILTIMCVLGLAVVARAQTVIGSWLTAPIPPSPANDEGWQDGNSSSGFGPKNGSIFLAANMPSLYELKAGKVAGYSQSLDVHETGFGNARLFVQLSAAQVQAFTNGSQLNFTFSCDSAANEGITSGFMQMVQFQFNSNAGFMGPAVSTAGGFSETGTTNFNSNGQPAFDFFTGSPAASQVVSWSYASLKPLLTNITFVQLVFVFQTGGPTNIYINNVTISGAQVPTIIVDQFNPTNNPFAGTNIYANGDITNIYANWFGGAFSNAVWDPTMDAQGNTNSGSLEVTANFGTNFVESTPNQFTLMDKGPGFSYAGINPPITNGLGLLTFQCDLKYDPSSPVWITGGGTNFGQLRFGVVPPFANQDFFGSVQVSVTNTGWVHVTIPINPALDPNLLSISGIIFGMDGASFGNLQGTTRFWIDNLAFTFTNLTAIPPTVMHISQPIPAMRLFAGSTGQFDRQEVATADSSQSWIGGSFPVSYSFTIKNLPGSIAQTHIFLIPVNSIPSGSTPYSNNGIDFAATNGLWLTINPGATNVTALVSWKVNAPGANAYQASQGGVVALTITNATGVGTWTLTFNSANTGTLTAPGGNPAAFTIADPNAATDFATPVVAEFGLQANASPEPGTFEDWASISVHGVAGVNENEDFTKEPDGNLPSAWMNMCAAAADLVIVSTNDLPAYWINWNLPATGLSLGSSTNLPASQWINPAFYNDYDDITAPRVIPATYGPNTWVLLPFDDLPTLDGSQHGPLAPNSFFELSTDVVSP